MKFNIFYVYAYLDPRKPGNYNYGPYHFDYEPFYIGKGSNGRYRSKNHNKSCNNIINEISNFGLKIITIFPYNKILENTAYTIEKEMVKIIGRLDLKTGPLTNKSEGGRRPFNIIFTEEMLKKIRGPRGPQKNPKISLSEEHKQNIGKSVKGQKHTEKTKQNISLSLKGKKRTEKSKQKMSISQRKKWLIIKNDEQIFIIDNMKTFCIENNLSYWCMTQTNGGTRNYNSYKGYKCKIIK